MTRTLATAPLLMLLAASVPGLSGCVGGLASPAGAATVTPLDIPPPRVPHPALTADIASMVYPDPEQIARDPFLTVTEEAIADGKEVPVVEAPKPVVSLFEESKRPRRPRALPTPKARIIKQLHDEVRGIILGKHNTFEFHGQLYEAGDVIENSDWVVQSISEAGIRLRTKDGSGSDFLPFKTAAAINFEFSGNSEPSTKDARPVESATKQF